MNTKRPQQPHDTSTTRTTESVLIALVRLLARQAAGKAFTETQVRKPQEQDHAEQAD